MKENLSFLITFPRKMADRGIDYYSRGFVKNFRYEKAKDDQLNVTASVLGSKKNVYDIFLTVQINQDLLEFHGGRCSCPIGYKCKHIAATLIKSYDLLIKQKIGQAPELTITEWNKWWNDLKISPIENAVKSSEMICYVFDESFDLGEHVLSVMIGKSRILKQGNLGKIQPLSVESSFWRDHAINTDAEIAFMITKENGYQHTTDYLVGNQSGFLFKKILETNRAFWRDISCPLKIADQRRLIPNWKFLSNGYQQLEFEVAEEGQVLPLLPPWYLDKEHQACGILYSDLDVKNLSPLLKAPKIAPDDVDNFKDFLSKNDINIPDPQSYIVEKKDIIPNFHIHVFMADEIREFSWESEQPSFLVRPSFLYGKTKISVTNKDNPIRVLENNKIFESSRDLDKEEKFLKGFLNEKIPLEYLYPDETIYEKYLDCFVFSDEYSKTEDKLAIISKAVQWWKDKKFSVSIDSNFPYHFISSKDWYMDTQMGSQMQWFDLELGIELEGRKVNLLPNIVSWIQENPKIFQPEALHKLDNKKSLLVKMPDKKYIELPIKKIKQVLLTLCELYDPDSLENGKLKIPKIRAKDVLDNAKQFKSNLKEEEALKQFAKSLEGFKGILTIDPPKKFKTELRGYQKEGLNWLQFLSTYQLGGILADDMGLGKTIQTLAHLCLEREKVKTPSLVIAPTSLMGNWNQEIKKFAPHLKALILHGQNRHELFSKIPKSDVVVTTYPLLIRDHEQLLKHPYHAVILDEAQVVKNARTKYAKICRDFEAHHRICLTGTPMENHLEELWALFDFVLPGLLGTSKQFKRVFRVPIEKDGALSLQKSLVKRISPFMLRRTKDKVVKELPPKTEMVQTIEIEGGQRKLYEGIRLSMQKKVKKALESKGLNASQILILDALLKLRQACCDPRLLPLKSAEKVKESAKFEYLKEMLTKLIEEDRKILLFSSFTSMLKLIEDHLIAEKISYSKLTGQTRKRSKEIDRFQKGKNTIFLISLKAGGVGLNLTAADTVIHYDPWWNPAAENQATDRAHRIGQDKPVFVYKLITKNTVEEKILKLQEKKQALMDGLFDQKRKSSARLSLEDVEDLFKPLESSNQ